MADGLQLTGGAGGAAADVVDLRTCAQVADELASHVGGVAARWGSWRVPTSPRPSRCAPRPPPGRRPTRWRPRHASVAGWWSCRLAAPRWSPVASPTWSVNQMTLMDVAKDDPDGSRLRVIEVPSGSGSSGIVQVPGTQASAGGPDPSDMVRNLYLSGLKDGALLDAIGTALDAHGVGDDPILVAGHSQGGIAAVDFAAQGQERATT